MTQASWLEDVVNISSALRERTREHPFARAIALPIGRGRDGKTAYRFWNFRELDHMSDVLARGLTAAGIGRGVRTALLVKPGMEFFALTFALFKAGAVPVLIDPGIGIRNMGRCLAEAEPAAFIGIPVAQLVRRLLGWGRHTIQQSVTVRPFGKPPKQIIPLEPFDPKFGVFRSLTLAQIEAAGHSDAPFDIAPTAHSDTAAVLFTSGSTGPPKGAVYTHGIFVHQLEMLRAEYGIEPGEVDLCTFPLFALFAPALGMLSVVPQMDATRPAQVDPTKILEPIQTFQVTNMFGSPALLRRVADYGAERGVKLPSLRRVVSAGAPVPARVLEKFSTMLEPDVQIFTPYGATESLPVASIGSREILGETRHHTDRGGGVCVGKPVKGMRVEVIPIRDDMIDHWTDDLVLPPNRIGEFAVQGPVVTTSYFQRPDATMLAKIAPDVPGQGVWHRMGDVGYRDDLGRLWFCGRKSHRVVTPEGTLFTIPCEAVFNTHPEVNRTALVGVGPRGQARPVLCVEPKYWPLSSSRRRTLMQELADIADQFEHTQPIHTFLFKKTFPVDIRHNAKIFREKLAVWAARRV